MKIENVNSDLKSMGVFIFGGSASLGVMNSGYHIESVLELTDDMIKENAYHFNKNYPNIPIVSPKEWEKDDYLTSLKAKNLDLIFANCPCSSLSQINRNASVEGENNIHFYRVFNVVEKVQPKVFFIENAPTLIKLGYPIIKDMVNKLEENYKFSIIRDFAGHHGVPMKRMRTLVVGWRKDVFGDKIPHLLVNAEKANTKDCIGDLYEYPVGDPRINNHTLVFNETWTPNEHLFKHVPAGKTAILGLIENWNNADQEVTCEPIRNEVSKIAQKIKEDKRFWNKSPYRVGENDNCPSMTSVTRLIHPIHDRSFTIREYARLMGYTDDFIFYPEECETPVIQCLAQGVPRKFVEYIATEIKESLAGNREFVKDSEDKTLCFQHNIHETTELFTLDQINAIDHLGD